MNAKLAALLAELDKRRRKAMYVVLDGGEYDLLREALREREGMAIPSTAVITPRSLLRQAAYELSKGELRQELFDLADSNPMREHEREGMVLVPMVDIKDLLHAISVLFAVTDRGDCLAERKPTKDESAYNAFTYLNGQIARVRAMLAAAEGK